MCELNLIVFAMMVSALKPVYVGRFCHSDLAGRRVLVHDRLEQMADDRVQDDQPMRRDPEHEPDRTDQSKWCLGGLTMSQK